MVLHFDRLGFVAETASSSSSAQSIGNVNTLSACERLCINFCGHKTISMIWHMHSTLFFMLDLCDRISSSTLLLLLFEFECMSTSSPHSHAPHKLFAKYRSAPQNSIYWNANMFGLSCKIDVFISLFNRKYFSTFRKILKKKNEALHGIVCVEWEKMEFDHSLYAIEMQPQNEN